MKPPFRAEHIGSLLRPPELKAARRGFEEKALSEEALREIEDRCIDEAIARQEGVGLQSITDGEYRRSIYFGHFARAVDGFTEMDAAAAFRDDEGGELRYRTPVVTGKLKRRRGIATSELAYVRRRTGRTPKVTLPSPESQHFFRFREGISDAVYPDVEELFEDIARIYREELSDLASIGGTYVQLDSVSLPLLCDPGHREAFRTRGYDPDRFVARYVDLINASVGGRPPELTLGVHFCRGNNQGKWLGEGGYEPVAEEVFSRLDADGLFLEFDTPRAGGFAPLAHVPRGKHVVLGLVSTKSPALEPEGELVRRVEQASRFVELERLSLSPQCGFASTEAGNPLTADEQWRKLELVVRTAERLWS
jgi:5-methyltetrahydropteroyltriglutamate--homocysteine methyltransferase